MKNFFRYAIPALVLSFGIALTNTSLNATVKIAKETGAKCVACHVKAASKDLNDAGKCYKDKKDLKACSIAAAPAK